jgi:apolipoprotein D and lipocalin family protein
MKRLALIALLLAACAPDHPSARYLTVGQVAQPIDVARLEGTWYEVATFPAGYTADCVGTTVTFTAPSADGLVGVMHQCQLGGRTVQISDTLRAKGPGRLAGRVDTELFTGELVVLGGADGGKTLFLGTQSRVTGFVLHRDRDISPETIDRAEEVFRANGYDVAALQRTKQR